MEIFAKRLKELRIEKNFSIRTLATKIGLSKSSIENYEGNKCDPSLETLNKLAEIFSVTVDYLLGRTDYES